MTGILWAAGVTALAVAVFLVWLGLKAQKGVNPVGNEALVGDTGIVRKTSGFRKRIVIEVRGENWWSRLQGGGSVSPGQEVLITGLDPDDMVLTIEPAGRG